MAEDWRKFGRRQSLLQECASCNTGTAVVYVQGYSQLTFEQPRCAQIASSEQNRLNVLLTVNESRLPFQNNKTIVYSDSCWLFTNKIRRGRFYFRSTITTVSLKSDRKVCAILMWFLVFQAKKLTGNVKTCAGLRIFKPKTQPFLFAKKDRRKNEQSCFVKHNNRNSHPRNNNLTATNSRHQQQYADKVCNKH